MGNAGQATRVNSGTRGHRRPGGEISGRRVLVALTVVISIILLGLIPQAVGSAGALPQHASAGRAALASADWSSYLDGPSHDSYNGAAKSISTSNIANLQPVWRALIKDPTNNTNTFRASPTVVDGIVYIG